nr:putative phospholipase B-like 2 [Dermacentor andersoni]
MYQSSQHGSIIQLLICALSTLAVTQDARTKSAWATLEMDTQKVIIHDGELQAADFSADPSRVPVAWATFRDDIKESGWSYLQVESNERVPDELQAYAAGTLEAHLTRERMEQHWTNLFSGYCDNQAEYCRRLEDFSMQNIEYTRKQQHERRDSDPFWNMLHLHTKQLTGLSDAWENETLDFTHEISGVTRAFILNLVGDLQDLERALGRTKDLNSIDQILACTALVKIVGDFDDLYIAHDTWFLYRAMLRVQKKYIFPWHLTASDTTVEKVIPGHTITTPSYPGMLVSWDGFYLTSAGMLLNDNNDLWKEVTPEGHFGSPGSVATARIATSGEEWLSVASGPSTATKGSKLPYRDPSTHAECRSVSLQPLDVFIRFLEGMSAGERELGGASGCCTSITAV